MFLNEIKEIFCDRISNFSEHIFLLGVIHKGCPQLDGGSVNQKQRAVNRGRGRGSTKC